MYILDLRTCFPYLLSLFAMNEFLWTQLNARTKYEIVNVLIHGLQVVSRRWNFAKYHVCPICPQSCFMFYLPSLKYNLWWESVWAVALHYIHTLFVLYVCSCLSTFQIADIEAKIGQLIIICMCMITYKYFYVGILMTRIMITIAIAVNLESGNSSKLECF